MTQDQDRIVSRLAEGPWTELSGHDIAEGLGMSTGRLYPALMRLEEDGVLVSRWGDPVGDGPEAPRRRLYRLSAEGFRKAA